MFGHDHTTERQQALTKAIARHGYTVMTVSPDGGDENLRWFAYTVGLWPGRQWPELIVFGLDHDDMARLLSAAVKQIEIWETQPKDGMELPVVAGGAALRLRRLDPGFYEEHLGWANWYAAEKGAGPPAGMQLLWPDDEGRFPGEFGCDEAVVIRQTPVSDGKLV
jgi:hypothetical protein